MKTHLSDRNKQIESILSSLTQLHPQSETEKYANEQNILFFRSIKSIPSYVRWLYSFRKRIRGSDLLEINELLPSLDEIFHSKMAEIERRPNPGIIRPIVDYITKFVENTSKDRRIRIVSLGSGSMEAERQVIEKLQKKGNVGRLTIIGFDISIGTRAFAEKNLCTLRDVRVVLENNLTTKKLVALEEETKEDVLFVVAANDIFTLTSTFVPQSFDLVMTALFLHHLEKQKRVKLIEEMKVLAPKTLNYDGYQSEFVLPLLSMTGWHSPVFLNAAIFSTIRFSSKKDVLSLHPSAKLDFYNHGHYRATFSV